MLFPVNLAKEIQGQICPDVYSVRQWTLKTNPCPFLLNSMPCSSYRHENINTQCWQPLQRPHRVPKQTLPQTEGPSLVLHTSLPLSLPLALFHTVTPATRSCCDSKEEGADRLGWALDMRYKIEMETKLTSIHHHYHQLEYFSFR
jgi:hypothetical protein